MAAVGLGAAAGLFGEGWLSRDRVASQGLAVEYPRFWRAHAPFQLTVEWPASQPETVLWLSRAYIAGFDLAEIEPPPASVAVGMDRIYYAFRARDAETLMTATFTLEPRGAGPLRGALGVDGGPEVEARQWVFP
jgi:hypothetical protein